MIRNEKTPGKNKPGEGPRVLAITGGYGGRCTYEGAALDWHLCSTLTSVNRLRIVSLLCSWPWLQGPVISKILEIPAISVHTALWGMRDFHLVEWRYTQHSRWNCDKTAMEWRVTDDGRKWFWRFAKMTVRACGPIWGEGFEGDEEIAPWEALRVGAHITLCRPAGLATARFMMMNAPICTCAAVRALGFPGARKQVERWRRIGWLVPAPKRKPGYHGWVQASEQPLRFTREALEAISRHGSAVRHAGQWCGYEGDTWLEDYLKGLHPEWFEVER